MNSWKVAAIFFAFFSLSAIKETVRIAFSNDADIAMNRGSLVPISIIGTAAFIWATIFFWKKSKQTKL